MIELTNAQIAPMLDLAKSVEELDAIVTSRYGPNHIQAVRKAAVQRYGLNWIRGQHFERETYTMKDLYALLRPTNLILMLGCIFEIIIFLYPPYSALIQQGFTVHMGFHSIFIDSGGQRYGAINVALLALEFLAVVFLTATCYLIAQRAESNSK